MSSYRFWRPYRASAITLASMKRASSQRTSFVTLARPSIVEDCRHPPEGGSIHRQPFDRESDHERVVGCQDVPATEAPGRHPREALDLDCGRLAVDDRADIHQHHEVERRVGV